MNQTETDMLSAHIQECTRYGVTPLNEDSLKLLVAIGYGLEEAFSVASDIDCGFSWEDAVSALR